MMFTGIVTAVGEIVAVEHQAGLRRIMIAADESFGALAVGASVACAGICLTAARVSVNGRMEFAVDVGPETLALTTAGEWRVGTLVNLERSLRLGDELGGHMVTGHIDGTAEIVGRDDHPETVMLRLSAPEHLSPFIAAKGSVALDGTSLTVNRVDGDAFECHLIPHTLAVTTWAERRAGDRVNLEVDLIARYIRRLMASA